MSLSILLAPSGFKECLDAEEVADRMEEGIRRALPDAHVLKAPLVDGGEGTTRALVKATSGELLTRRVTGPVGTPVNAPLGFLGGDGPRTAVVEMAAAAGLALVPREVRDPRVTTTRGVGELIRAALDAGAERILVGCGDSGTNDGGAGMAQALGARLLDSEARELGPGGGELSRLERIDLSQLDPRVRQVRIDVACNIHNVLCGNQGVARVFGPQKGACAEVVDELAHALDRYALVVAHETGADVREMPGSGASGGLGAGLHALLGARLHPRFEVVMRYLAFDELLAEADLVMTAEGGIDSQTPRGKVPAEVARRAKLQGLPVIALAGTIGNRARINLSHGIDSYASIVKAPCSLDDAIEGAPALVRSCAERMLRMVLVGIAIGEAQADSAASLGGASALGGASSR